MNYHYNTTKPPNMPTHIGGASQQDFGWDANGNMIAHSAQLPSCHNERHLCWDEQNRLRGVKDNGYLSYYQYDAGGDRTYKLPYLKTYSNRSGRRSVYWAPEHSTLYASPYLVVTPQGYTKHYYAESERITTQLGKSCFTGIDSCVAGDSLASIKLQEAVQVFPTDSFPTPTPMLGYLHSLTNHPNTVSTLYFYHPDHLGSASWITNIYGRTIQHLYYLPWGEDFVNQRTGSFSSMYTFSAKEKDAETGYSYFGARYYSSDLSIWLSVDPMAGKYPSLSPYVYCANNPVKLVDPNGEEYDVFITGEGAEWVTQQLSDAYQNLNITRDQFGRLHTDVDDVSSLTKDEKLIYDAINSNDVVVNIDVTSSINISTEFGEFILNRTSGFLGNILSDNKKMAFTRQIINKQKVISTYYPEDRGRLIAHELTESYLGGMFSLEKECLAPPAIWANKQDPITFNPFYSYAHSNAIVQPYNKSELREMFCVGFSCNKYVYDLIIEKALRR